MEQKIDFSSEGYSIEGLLEKNSESGADHFYCRYTDRLEAVLAALFDD